MIMNAFTAIDVKLLKDNPFYLLDDVWMLITAGTIDSMNTMTASWGGMGILWNKPVAFIFIRPHRHTFSFVDKKECFTLCFFDEEYRKILNYCGKYSGREVDKIKKTGLVPINTPNEYIYFEQARLVMECRKLYYTDIREEQFVDKSLIDKIYPTRDFHRLFVGEITRCLIRSDHLS
jgi:flavin reductase (DIM6/NTAB) family NADH-FMN oxidoreductase RutF